MHGFTIFQKRNNQIGRLQDQRIDSQFRHVSTLCGTSGSPLSPERPPGIEGSSESEAEKEEEESLEESEEEVLTRKRRKSEDAGTSKRQRGAWETLENLASKNDNHSSTT